MTNAGTLVTPSSLDRRQSASTDSRNCRSRFAPIRNLHDQPRCRSFVVMACQLWQSCQLTKQPPPPAQVKPSSNGHREACEAWRWPPPDSDQCWQDVVSRTRPTILAARHAIPCTRWVAPSVLRRPGYPCCICLAIRMDQLGPFRCSH